MTIVPVTQFEPTSMTSDHALTKVPIRSPEISREYQEGGATTTVAWERSGFYRLSILNIHHDLEGVFKKPRRKEGVQDVRSARSFAHVLKRGTMGVLRGAMCPLRTSGLAEGFQKDPFPQ